MRFIKYAAVASLCGTVAIGGWSSFRVSENAAAIGGCSSFLDAEKAVADPNNPTAATTNQLFVAALAAIFGQQEGGAAMNICEWVQQCAGVGGRFVDTQGTYSITGDSFDGSFQSVY